MFKYFEVALENLQSWQVNFATIFSRVLSLIIFPVYLLLTPLQVWSDKNNKKNIGRALVCYYQRLLLYYCIIFGYYSLWRPEIFWTPGTYLDHQDHFENHRPFWHPLIWSYYDHPAPRIIWRFRTRLNRISGLFVSSRIQI